MLLNTHVALKYVITVSVIWGCKMRRSALIARLNSLRRELEKSEDEYNLQTVESCLYYFINHEDADPYA